MFKKINPQTLDDLTLKHTVLANFGFLLANTMDKHFNEKLDINMKNLTSYLIDSALVEVNELKEIIQSQSNFGITNHYHFSKVFKGDELTEPNLLFQVTSIIKNLASFLFKKNHTINKFIKEDKFLRKRLYLKPIFEIYTSYFNIIKFNAQYMDIINKHKNINTIQANLIESIDFHYHPSEKSIFLYEAHDLELIIKNLKNKRIALLETLCEITHMQLINCDSTALEKIAEVLYYELEEFKNSRSIDKYLTLSSFYEIFEKHTMEIKNAASTKLS